MKRKRLVFSYICKKVGKWVQTGCSKQEEAVNLPFVNDV